MTYNTKTGKGKNTKDMDYNNSSRRFRPWGSRVVALSIKCASLALRTESREEWIFSSGINLWFFLHVSMRMVRVREKVFSFLEIQRLQLPGSSSTVFAVNLILTYVTQIQFSQCLFQCSVTGAGSTGGARGPRPPIFRPEWGLKGRKNIFWRPPSPPPPQTYLRVWMTGLDPALVTGLSDLTHAYLPCTQLINWLVMTQLTHKKQSTRKQSGDIYSEHFESENGIMTRAPNGNFRENICSEDGLRTRIFGAFVVKFLACLPLLGFSNIYKMV